VVDHPRIREIDINPLLASSDGLLALDARIVLFGADVADDDLPRPAIRPYPAQYVTHWTAKNGKRVTFRPIRPEDEPLMVDFHRTLSDSAVYLRYFHVQKLDSRIAHERLIRRCCVDYDREVALVAENHDAGTGNRELLAVGRLARQQRQDEAELGVLVTDRWQGAGLGTEMVARLIDIGRRERIRRIVAHILMQNAPMLALAKRYHFDLTRDEDPLSHLAVLNL